MNSGFWHNLPRPFFILAPMADVTDAPFRQLIAKYGKPNVTYTEFVSADGLARAPEEGRKKLLQGLIFTEAERPIVAQFFTADPEHMKKAVRLAISLGFDGVDINMGCPDRAVEHQNAGAALIKNPALARQLIRAAKEEAGSAIPVSVKTRIGYNQNEIETWLPELLAEEPAAITIHARTRKEMSDVPARWDVVKRAVEIRNELKKETLIIGNGDVKDIADAKMKAAESGADGVMLGRAIFGNPWLFAERGDDAGPIDPKTKLATLVEHAALFEKIFGRAGEHQTKNFAVMKKHFKAYVAGWPGSVELRLKLMDTHTTDEVKAIIAEYLQSA